MAYQIIEEKKGQEAIVWNGFENGIGPSPHKGIANMQAVDIDTEMGEVMCSYQRTKQSQVAGSGTGALTVATTSILAVNSGLGPLIRNGTWINVSGSTITGLANGNYYVISQNGSYSNYFIALSSTYSIDGSTVITGYSGGGTASFTTLFDMAEAVQGATERYVNTNGVTRYRYYVLDTNGRLWFHSTETYAGLVDTPLWALPYTATITAYNGGITSTACGLAVMNGYVFIFAGDKIFTVSTSQLGTTPASFSAGSMLSKANTTNLHFAFAGHQGRLYYTDGSFVGSIFPDTSVDSDLTTPITNVQSYCSYTSSTTTGTITAVLNGSYPTESPTGTPSRIPAYFFPAYAGTQPTNLTAGTKYYIQYTPGTTGTFSVYAAQTGGAAINLDTGAAGVQYFNTFFPQSGDGNKTLVFLPERLLLPSNEIATCISELGNTIIIGTQSNYLYPWNQVDTLPGDLLPMPESYTTSMVTVNNVIYVFAGFRGNIYITNASSVSLALSVPDYVSGLVQPYFIWGGSMFLRGRVYFSIQDQTSSHTGQCGGIWSFIPVQNFSYNQNIGMALRMDNKNSYNTFNGRCTVLIPSYDQQVRSPQYYSVWTSSISNTLYGIDFTDTVLGTAAVIQTDIASTGTMLDKKTFTQIEYKLAAPLAAGETVTLAYRTNLTTAFASAGTVQVETTTDLSGYVPVNFEKTQWVQLQATLTPLSDPATSSFVRLTELRLR